MSRNAHFRQGLVPTSSGEAVTSDDGVGFLRRAGNAWARERGYKSIAFRPSEVAMPAEATQRISDAYMQMPSHSPEAVPHFKAMAEETMRQLDHLQKLGVNVEVTDEDPYPGPRELVNDLRENNRIKVLSTAATGGHPFFSNDQNDAFRAVHDAFGHAAIGRGFDRHGEEAAFLTHRRMFSPMARPALATETRGQNSAFITTGAFPEQKVNTLPSGLQLPVLSSSRSGMRQAVLQSRQFHKEQFGE